MAEFGGADITGSGRRFRRVQAAPAPRVARKVRAWRVKTRAAGEACAFVCLPGQPRERQVVAAVEQSREQVVRGVLAESDLDPGVRVVERGQQPWYVHVRAQRGDRTDRHPSPYQTGPVPPGAFGRRRQTLNWPSMLSTFALAEWMDPAKLVSAR